MLWLKGQTVVWSEEVCFPRFLLYLNYVCIRHTNRHVRYSLYVSDRGGGGRHPYSTSCIDLHTRIHARTHARTHTHTHTHTAGLDLQICTHTPTNQTYWTIIVATISGESELRCVLRNVTNQHLVMIRSSHMFSWLLHLLNPFLNIGKTFAVTFWLCL